MILALLLGLFSAPQLVACDYCDFEGWERATYPLRDVDGTFVNHFIA